MDKVNNELNKIISILSDWCESEDDLLIDYEDYFVLAPFASIVYEEEFDKWFISFNFSIVQDTRHSGAFALIVATFWEQGMPVYVSEAYYAIFDNEGFHIYNIWESEIYQTMYESKEEDYEIVKNQLIEFYKNSGIRDNIH